MDPNWVTFLQPFFMTFKWYVIYSIIFYPTFFLLMLMLVKSQFFCWFARFAWYRTPQATLWRPTAPAPSLLPWPQKPPAPPVLQSCWRRGTWMACGCGVPGMLGRGGWVHWWFGGGLNSLYLFYWLRWHELTIFFVDGLKPATSHVFSCHLLSIHISI